MSAIKIPKPMPAAPATQAEAVSKSNDTSAIASQIEKISERLDGIEAVLKGPVADRKVAKSKVPVVTEPARKSNDLWSNSPFDIAADL